MKKFILYLAVILTVILSLASVAALIYFGVFVMFVGGLIQVVEALKQTDIPASDVAIGCARVVFTSIGTGLLAVGLFLLNGFVWLSINEGFDNLKRQARRQKW